MARCAICSVVSPEPVGTLCRGCARILAGPRPHAPGIATSRVGTESPAAWLIDAWGQIHPVGPRCAIGRDPRLNDLIIAHLTVSAEHAELRRQPRSWKLRDRGSANGTGRGGLPQVREALVSHRDHLWFGEVAFYLWADAEPPARDIPPPDVSTLVPRIVAFRLADHDRGEILVRAAPGHAIDVAPGDLVYRASEEGTFRRAALARLQFQLLRALCEAAVDSHDERMGKVTSHELVGKLPFQTIRPDSNHVREVVSTLRTRLDRVGVPGGGSAGPDGLIHASDGGGYRVTWRVSRHVEEPR